MAQPSLAFKIFILCLLNNAIGSQREKTELDGQPKNILVFLVVGMSSDVITNVRSDLAKGPGGAPSNASYEIPFENMPIHGTILNRENPGNGLDLDALRKMFNKPDLEDTSKNGSTSRHSSNLMYFAKQVKKNIGFITTVNTTLEIPSAIFFTLLESSYPGASSSSVANNVSTNEFLTQVTFFSQRFQTLETLKASISLNFISSTLGHPEGSDAASKEKTEEEDKILHVDMKDIRKETSAVLQSLKKNINGFFLVVSVDGGNPVVNVQTASHLIDDVLSSDLSQETLIIVTSLKENVICCRSASTEDGQKKVYSDNGPSSAFESKQSNALNHPAKTVPPQKNIPELNANSPKIILQKTTDEPWEKSTVKQVPSTASIKMPGEERPLVTREGSTPSGTGLLGSAVTTGSSAVTNGFLTSSSTENSTPTPQKHSTSKNNRGSKGNVHKRKPEKSTESMSTINGNAFAPPTATEASLPSDDINIAKSQEQVPPVPDREDIKSGSVLGPTELNQTKPSDATFSSSITTNTEKNFSPTEKPINKNQGNNPSIEEKLSTSEGLHTPEGNVNLRRTGNDNFKERSKRETESDPSQLGIPLYAAGPGSSSFQRTLSSRDLYTILQIYIDSGSTSVENSEIKGNLGEMNGSRVVLSADDTKTNSAFDIRKTNYLCFVIAILNIIMWF